MPISPPLRTKSRLIQLAEIATASALIVVFNQRLFNDVNCQVVLVMPFVTEVAEVDQP